MCLAVVCVEGVFSKIRSHVVIDVFVPLSQVTHQVLNKLTVYLVMYNIIIKHVEE